jgi:hypothetical protein
VRSLVAAVAMLCCLAPANALSAPDGGPSPAADLGSALGSAPSSNPATAGGFRLEGRSAIDDVFGDAADYRRTIDRFLELSSQMSQMRDEFARSVQATLTALGVRGVRPGTPARRGCPIDTVAVPYARANKLGGDYLRLGREVTRHHEQIREFDRLGESVGLTPDYRTKVRRVLNQYRALVIDYREMKIAFHDQLVDELRYAGCDLWALLQKGDPQSKRPEGKPDEEWPAPGTPGAPGTPVGPAREPPPEQPPANLPNERVPVAQPILIPKRPADVTSPHAGILFYVDNTRCRRASSVFLDGDRLGEVPGGTRAGFQSRTGPHDLCLVDSTARRCGDPGTMRRSYLHEGWTITLRCD